MTVKAFAAQSANGPLEPMPITRRATSATDVQIEILYCGVCHSDLHQARDEWHDFAPTNYPCVPGHEIVGRVSKVGTQVTKFKIGDLAAVGCMVDSCRTCPNCTQGLEQYCKDFPTFTYNSKDVHSGSHTLGGYSEQIVVDEAFTLQVPANLDLAACAPLLCAGITTWSPLKHWKVGPGQKVGVIGLGGLGHMGVKFARALGAHLVLFTTSPGKIEDGKRLGAHEVVVSTNPEELGAHRGSFDFILDCVSAQHDVNAYLALLKLDGTLCIVGAPEKPLPVIAFSLLMPRKNFSGSGIGGLAETQEMLEFCALHQITCDIELIPIQKINEAYSRLIKGDVKYRFVIDMATLKKS